MNPPSFFVVESLAAQHRADLLRDAERVRMIRAARSHRRLSDRTRRRFMRWS